MNNNKLSFLFEDEHLFVVDKPNGLVVNDSSSQAGKITLQKLVKDKFVYDNFDNNIVEHVECVNRGGIVHRLDADTSGIVIIAKNVDSYIKIKKQFKNRSVYKEYIALVYGTIKECEIADEVVVDAPIGRNPNNRHKFAIVADGKPAITKIIIKNVFSKRNDKYSYLKLLPKTGRTHQIRVHLTSLNNPIVGDPIYSGKSRYKRDCKIFNRMFLHSRKLIFKHPVTNFKVEVESRLPDNLIKILDWVNS